MDQDRSIWNYQTKYVVFAALLSLRGSEAESSFMKMLFKVPKARYAGYALLGFDYLLSFYSFESFYKA